MLDGGGPAALRPYPTASILANGCLTFEAVAAIDSLGPRPLIVCLQLVWGQGKCFEMAGRSAS